MPKTLKIVLWNILCEMIQLFWNYIYLTETPFSTDIKNVTNKIEKMFKNLKNTNFIISRHSVFPALAASCIGDVFSADSEVKVSFGETPISSRTRLHDEALSVSAERLNRLTPYSLRKSVSSEMSDFLLQNGNKIWF